MKTSLLIFSLLILTSNIFSQEERFGIGVYQHDGFYLRLAGGFGYAQLTKDELGSDFKLSGLGMSFLMQVGGTVSENLIIYCEIGGVVTDNPDFKLAGKTVETEKTKVIMTGFGAGLTYYFMPTNIYVSFSALLSSAAFEVDHLKPDVDPGFGLNTMAGKEWWLDDDLGIGAAFYIYYSTMNEKDSDNTINNFSIGVLLSATFN